MSNPNLNFDRQYVFSAKAPSGLSFEVGHVNLTARRPLHCKFQIQKTSGEEGNTSTINLWNLTRDQISILEEKDCLVALRAGYNTRLALAFTGTKTFTHTELEKADKMTTIEAVDGRVAIRDTWITLQYNGVINTQKILSDIAGYMGTVVIFGHNATFIDLPNGYSFVGKGADALTAICNTSGLQWSIQNGVLQIKQKGDTISREVYVITHDTGLVDIPKRISFGAENEGEPEKLGWEVNYLLNAAIGVDDYIRLEAKYLQGYFRVHTVSIDGDSDGGRWTCTAKLMEV